MFVVYRIVHNESSQDSYHFSIDPESGVIRTQNNLDRETTSNYSVSVVAFLFQYRIFPSVLATFSVKAPARDIKKKLGGSTRHAIFRNSLPILARLIS